MQTLNNLFRTLTNKVSGTNIFLKKFSCVCLLLCRYDAVDDDITQVSNNTGILYTCTQLWLTESEQMTPMDSIKDIVRSSV